MGISNIYIIIFILFLYGYFMFVFGRLFERNKIKNRDEKLQKQINKKSEEKVNKIVVVKKLNDYKF